MNRPAAIYARVSSDRQKENHTITSQTAALKEYAQAHDYLVPTEWVFEDEGYSGATLVRPGLEALRDLAARGEIQTVLVYSPDRLSRKYAYQVLLAEELQRCGVSLVFLKAPAGETAEDRLLEQFQGMIAEYERAQILERSRRGKRHKAQAGVVSVLSGAPYGYRYLKKSDTAEACYEVIEAEAEVVHAVFDLYTRGGLSINAIARHLNQQQIATRRGDTRWERSTVWALLRNPAYQGKACYGKTEIRPRLRITRPLRQRNRLPSRNSANHERPRQDWIEITVPALVNEETFAFAQEQLEKNRHYSRRRTIQPTLLQGMLVCRDCGYGLYRTSTRTSARKLYYYRCLGSDAYRHLRGALCANRPVRADYLDEFVWREIIRLLEEPALVQAEIDRRLAEAQIADPLRHREQSLRHQQVRLHNGIERLLTAYQEELLSLDQLRQRMPALRKQQQAVDAELQSLALAAADQSRYLRLTETLADFCTKLHARADALDVTEKQKIARLLVHEILVGKDTIVIRHSIPFLEPEPDRSGSSTGPATTSTTRGAAVKSAGYLLGSGSKRSSLRRPLIALHHYPVDHHASIEVAAD
jgi:site-specific DNA recombinase